MTTNNEHHDIHDELMGRLAEAIRHGDDVPAEQIEIAKGLFAWRTIDVELAELTYDSSTEELVGVRGSAGPRALTFEQGPVMIDVELTEDGRRTLTGMLVPAGSGHILVEALDGSTLDV